MAREVTTTGSKKLKTLMKEFNDNFPYLRIKIISSEMAKKAERGETISGLDIEKTLSEVREKTGSGKISFTGRKNVKTIENEFKVFAERLASSTGDFDIVKFFCSKKNPNIVSSFPIGPSHQLCRFRKVLSGNQGQLITYDGAKKLLATYERFGRPVDVDIQHWWESGINVLGVFPSVVKRIENAASDIDSQDTRKNKTTITGALRNLGLRLRYEYNLFTNRQTRPIPKLYKKN